MLHLAEMLPVIVFLLALVVVLRALGAALVAAAIVVARVDVAPILLTLRERRELAL